MRKKSFFWCILLAVSMGIAIFIPKGIDQLQIRNCIRSYINVTADFPTVQEINATVENEGISEAYNQYWKDIMSYECWDQALGNRSYMVIYQLADRGKKKVDQVQLQYFPSGAEQKNTAQFRVETTIRWAKDTEEGVDKLTYPMFFVLDKEDSRWRIKLIRV